VCCQHKHILKLDVAVYKPGAYSLLRFISISIYHNPKIFQIKVTDLKIHLTKHYTVKYMMERRLFSPMGGELLPSSPGCLNPKKPLY
jgi:hypothetical protein